MCYYAFFRSARRIAREMAPQPLANIEFVPEIGVAPEASDPQDLARGSHGPSRRIPVACRRERKHRMVRGPRQVFVLLRVLSGQIRHKGREESDYVNFLLGMGDSFSS